MDLRRFSLSNGVPLIAVPRTAGMPVAIQVWFLGGNRAEADDETSVAHLFEHLFFRGGRDFPDCRSVERELRLIGGIGNAATSDEIICAFIVTSPRHLKRALHLVSDMVLYAKCSPADLEKEAAAVVQELKATIDKPEDFSERKFRQVIFGDHPLGRLDFERMDILRRLTQRDVLRYKERFCGSGNALITVVGGINPEETAEMTEEFFGALPPSERALWEPFAQDHTLPPTLLVTRPTVEQAHIHVGAFAPSIASPEFRTSAMLHEILSHRLWLQIRIDKGLAYAANAQAYAFSDAGYFLVYAGVDPCEDAISKAMRIIFKEMADIKSGHISAEEIEETKSVMHAQLDLGLETSSQLGFFLAIRQLLTGETRTTAYVHEEIERISKEDLIRLAHELWREEVVRSLVLTTSFPGYEKKYLELRRMLRG